MRLWRFRSRAMQHWRGLGWCGVAVTLLLACTACDQRLSGDGDVSRALERGRKYRSQRLTAKAEETFKSILRDHPDEARAHKELVYLYLEDVQDYVSALYHVERFRALGSTSPANDLRSDMLERVRAICQQEIAKEVSMGVLTEALQEEIESLIESNENLVLQVENLKQRLAEKETSPSPPRPDDGRKEQAGTQAGGVKTGSVARTRLQEVPRREEPLPQPDPARAVPPRPRTHTIQKGDTLYSLARRYGVTVQQLQSANPRVEPNNLQIGQTIKISEP